MTLLPRRCAKTGNPCGTDTEMVGHPCQCDMCIAWREIETLKQGWATAFNIGVSEQEQNKKLRAEIERLRADNDFLRGVIGNAITAQDWDIARRALEQKASGEVT